MTRKIMNENRIGEKKALDEKAFALGMGIIFVLCTGIAWGYMASQTAIPDSYQIYGSGKKNANEKEQNNQAANNITYATFALPDAYFTFEYPANWIYEKEVSASEEEYNETFWNFYAADTDKKEPILTLHYPMYETALDSCLKFEYTSNYTLNRFPTNDTGTFVTYLDCKNVGHWSDAKASDLGSNIFWEKGTLTDNGTDIKTQDGTQARIMWGESLTGSDIIDHIAHSIKVVK